MISVGDLIRFEVHSHTMSTAQNMLQAVSYERKYDYFCDAYDVVIKSLNEKVMTVVSIRCLDFGDINIGFFVPDQGIVYVVMGNTSNSVQGWTIKVCS